MKKYKINLFLIILVLFAACSYPKEWTKIERNMFCLEMPPYTKAMEDISVQAADLEWGSFFKNFYLIVRHHPVQDLMELAESSKQKLLSNSNFHKPRSSKTRTFEVNNQKAVEWIIRGGVGKEALREEITYYHYFIENNTRTYELILWNWTKRDEEFKPDIDRIVNSFKGSDEGC